MSITSGLMTAFAVWLTAPWTDIYEIKLNGSDDINCVALGANDSRKKYLSL
jgi:hypothetical protein